MKEVLNIVKVPHKERGNEALMTQNSLPRDQEQTPGQ